MFLNRYLHIVYFCLLSIWASSCSTAYYLENYPVLAEDVFYRKVLSAEKKLDNDIDSAFLNALKLRTQYTFAFVVEKADRLIEVDYDANTITLIRGHGYPESEISNGFDWEFDNTHPYEYDNQCLTMKFYKIDNGWMTNCYPEQVFTNSVNGTHKILKLIKEL